MTPLEHYQQDLQSKEFQVDEQQRQAVLHLQRVYDDFIATQKSNARLWQKLLKKFRKPVKKPVRGLYLWGSVGIGKTWLMDTFYDCLPTQKKLRLHFHRFMKRVHHELQQLQGQRDPLKVIAKHFAAQAQIICFDEFFVADITDAMLLAGLLEALFNNGITLVMTSNVPPDQLYRNGLQRERFLPAIKLLQEHTEVVHVQSQRDYRLRALQQAGIYFYPLDADAAQKMRQSFEYFARGHGNPDELLIIEGRAIPTICCSNNVVWFDFQDICNVPRSQMDYLEIAQCYHTVLISNVQQISAEQDNLICYLINLVDVFYDANVKLILSAAVSIEQIYMAGRFIFEFQRTKSRLLEMQSQQYLQRSHGGQ